MKQGHGILRNRSRFKLALRRNAPVNVVTALAAMSLASTAWATEAEQLVFRFDNLWILLAAAMVFIMHLGFATLEAGAVRSKNSVNILFKNTLIIAIGLLTYAMVGFNLMYPGESFAGAMFGFAGFGLAPDADGLTTAYNASYTYWSDFIFQGMFAATAATIVSGAVAERIKLSGFVVFSVLFLSLAYPIVGMWKWGGGVLDAMSTPFYDFAGSTIVHSVGGWAALAGALILGPRLGRFAPERAKEFEPSNYSLATIGVFLLWFGWYGFNGGSVLSADPGALSLVFVTTSLAAAAGIVGAFLTASIVLKSKNLMLMLNGALAGLVAVTAGADVMGPMSAIIVGLIGGVIGVGATAMLDKWRIDDPVGAIPVHLASGIWGTLAVGLFGAKASLAQLASQAIGIVMIGAFVFAFAYITFKVIDLLIGLRVDAADEERGLDISEHTAQNYHMPETSPPAMVDGLLAKAAK